MKNKFLEKYWLCILLSVLMVIGMYLTAYYAEAYTVGGSLIWLNLSDLYLIYMIPIYSFLYGCLSYVKTKKIWVPQLIISAITCVFLFVSALIIDKTLVMWLGYLVISVWPVPFSLIGTLVAAFVCFMIKSFKEHMD